MEVKIKRYQRKEFKEGSNDDWMLQNKKNYLNNLIRDIEDEPKRVASYIPERVNTYLESGVISEDELYKINMFVKLEMNKAAKIIENVVKTIKKIKIK